MLCDVSDVLYFDLALLFIPPLDAVPFPKLCTVLFYVSGHLRRDIEKYKNRYLAQVLDIITLVNLGARLRKSKYV